MLLADLVVALVIGLVVTAVFIMIFRARANAPGVLVVFLLFFLFSWAGGLWLAPFGPPVFGAYWLPGLIVTVLVFLLLALVLEQPPRTRREARVELEARQEATTFFAVLLSILVVGLIVAIVIAYLV
jgi:hypothetical protein